MLQRQEGGWRGRKERRTSTVLWLTLRKMKGSHWQRRQGEQKPEAGVEGWK